MKAVVAAFNQEKALVGAFSVIIQLHRLIDLRHYLINNKQIGNWKVTIAPNSLLMVDLVVVASSTGVEHLEDDEVML